MNLFLVSLKIMFYIKNFETHFYLINKKYLVVIAEKIIQIKAHD